jgi:serine/threonine-protein kinase
MTARAAKRRDLFLRPLVISPHEASSLSRFNMTGGPSVDAFGSAIPADKTVSVTVPGVLFERKPPPVVSPGERLCGRYLVEQRLGCGGGGVVFRAWDAQARRAVALKFLRPWGERHDGGTPRLAREMSLARRVRHPNVCSVLDFEEDRGAKGQEPRAFIVMELAAGGCLGEEQERAAPHAAPPTGDEWARRVRDAGQACAGLAAIHDAGIAHRDFKPRNLLRMADGRLVVADFGLAVLSQENVSFEGGTPDYLAPEVTCGEPPDQRSDVWQLGVVLHEILLGRRPRWCRGGAGPGWAVSLGPEVPPEVIPWLQLAARCLAWDPDARPQTAALVLRHSVHGRGESCEKRRMSSGGA